MKSNPEIDAYIASFPPKTRALMKTIRAAIKKALPDGEERLSYRMAGYFRDGPVAYFAGFKNHIGFFPPTNDPKLKKAAAKFANARGNLKFALNTLPPYDLIAKLVQARAAENRAKAASRTSAAAKRLVSKKGAPKKTVKKPASKKVTKRTRSI
jgi:uncharacterized protein YdhG (YjbR/CyaY superfamily)